jgi:hypothetical protein
MHHYLGWISNLDLAFLCQYSNHAWGRRHHGWYITRGGELYSFKLDGGSYHTKKEGQIPSDELAEHQQLLEALASEPWEERHHMCDAGVYRVTGFLLSIHCIRGATLTVSSHPRRRSGSYSG